MTAVLKTLVGILAATSAVLLYFIIHEFNPFLRRCNPDVCHSYALSAFRVHSNSHQDSSPCQYGSLRGVLNFSVMKPAGARWQTAVPNCQLQNLLMPSPQTGHVKVLLLGDSVDVRLTRDWCTELQQPLRLTPPASMKGSVASFAAAVKTAVAGSSSSSSNASLANPEECCKDKDAMYYCTPDRGSAAAAASAADGTGTGSLSLGMYHILGVHLDGPFHTRAKGNFLTRVPLALKTFEAVFGGPPDLVLLHSNFWDQSRMWEQQQPGYGHLNKLPPDVVFSWSSNFSLLLSTTAELLPESTLMATRTAAFPALNANWLGRWPYIHQLNMAASEVARLHGAPVIDLAGMVFGLEPRQYLQDQQHPNKIVPLECANIAMNLLRQHQQGLGQTQTADGTDAPPASDIRDDPGKAAGATSSSDSRSTGGHASAAGAATANSSSDAAADVTNQDSSKGAQAAEGGNSTTSSAAADADAADADVGGATELQPDAASQAQPAAAGVISSAAAGTAANGAVKQQSGGRREGQQAGDVEATRKALNSSQQQGG